MQVKVALRLLSIGAFALALGACSAKISGGEGDAGPDPMAGPFNHRVSGPSLDGKWKSDCVLDRYPGHNGYVIYTMVINGQNVTRTEDLFNDGACTQAGEQLVHSGQFRYAALKTGSDVFEVEYRLKPAKGTSAGENIRLASGVLYISGYWGGDAYPAIALRKQP